MFGWRARLGFLVPPGNPTVEPEIARGTPGSLAGQSERNRMMLDNLEASVEMLALVKPDAIVLAHTASSYHMGRDGEAALLARLEEMTGTRVVTAFGSVLRALERLGVRSVALGAPYARETTLQGKAHLEAHGITVASFDNLAGVTNIYDETAERAYRLARQVDCAAAEAVFLTGTGMPTLPVLEALERDLEKPVVSSASAMMWHALRLAGVRQPISGYGRLLTLP